MSIDLMHAALGFLFLAIWAMIGQFTLTSGRPPKAWDEAEPLPHQGIRSNV